MGINTKHYALGLLEAVFGAFGKKSDEPGTHARCRRCGVRFAANVGQLYCSSNCSDAAKDPTPVEQGKMSRQQYRHKLRDKAKQAIGVEMGAGPRAMNPRRNRRRAILSRARNWFVEQRSADARMRSAEVGGNEVVVTDKRRIR